MDLSKLIRFFRTYALWIIVLSSLVSFSYVYAEVLVGGQLGGQLDNATISYALIASVPYRLNTQYSLSYALVASIPAGQGFVYTANYECELIVNRSGDLSTVPCYTTSSSTTSSTTTTTTSNFYSGGGGGGGYVPPSSGTSTAPGPGEGEEGFVLPFVGSVRIPEWIISFRGGDNAGVLALLTIGFLALLYVLMSGSGKRKRR